MLDQIQEFLSAVPKPVWFGVVLLVCLGAFFVWKRMSSKDRESENEVQKGVEASKKFAKYVQENLDQEAEPMMSTVTPQYAAEIQRGLADYEKEKETDVVVASTSTDNLPSSDDEFDDDE
jgi:hypothetical protein